MPTNIFVNLPVKDLHKSKEFFAKLGYSFNPQFTNEDAACLIISDTIYVMLLTIDFFKKFSKKGIVDATKSTEVIIAISVESKQKVDELVANAIEAGGTKTRDTEDNGWMYSKSFDDVDGHQWEILYADQSKIKE